MNNTVVEIKLKGNGKYILIIDGVVIGYDYKTSSKACQRAYRYLKGQNRWKDVTYIKELHHPLKVVYHSNEWLLRFHHFFVYQKGTYH